MVQYAYMPEEKVSPDILRAAMMALAAARKELRLPTITIKWFVRVDTRPNPYNPHAPVNPDVYGKGTFEHAKDILGQYRGRDADTIYVRTGQTPQATKDTVYHEGFHLWQSLQGYGFNDDHSEGFAEGYAADAVKRMMATGDDETAYFELLSGDDKDWASPANAAAMRRALGLPELTG